MATETLVNVGLRKHFTTLGDRNFEDAGTVQYKAGRQPLEFLGTSYDVGDLLPFDSGSSYSTGTIALLLRYWEQEWITPAT